MGPAIRRQSLKEGQPGMSGEIRERNYEMIILGVALLLLGALLDIGILYTIGGIVAVVGVLLWLFGALGRQIGPRPHYY